MRLYTIKKESVLSAILLILFIGDAMNVVLEYYGFPFWKVSQIPRLIFQVAIILYFFSKTRIPRTSSHLLTWILFLLMFFIVGFGTFMASYTDADLVFNIKLFNKMVLFILIAAFMKSFLTGQSITQDSIVLKTYEVIILINGIAIIAGLIFHIEMFQSYQKYRFGYKGFIPAQNEATAFWLLATFYALDSFRVGRSKYLLFLCILCDFLVGTKGSIITAVIAILLTIYFFLKRHKIAIFLLPSFVFVLILSLPIIIGWITGFYSSSPVFSYFRNAADSYGLITALFSNRNNLANLHISQNTGFWNPLNWIFGGQDQTVFSTEMDFFDTFLFLGIFGSMIYISSYFYIFRGSNKFIQRIFLPFYMVIAFLGGHFFASSMNALYLSVIVLKSRLSSIRIQSQPIL